MRGAGGFDHGLVFGRVFVRLEKNFVQLFADRRGAGTRTEFRDPLGDLLHDQLLLLNRHQGLGNHVRPGFAEAPFARAAEIVGRLKQAE